VNERGRPDQIEWTGVVTWCKRVAPTEIPQGFAQINRRNLPNKYIKETVGAHRRASYCWRVSKTLANQKRSHNWKSAIAWKNWLSISRFANRCV